MIVLSIQSNFVILLILNSFKTIFVIENINYYVTVFLLFSFQNLTYNLLINLLISNAKQKQLPNPPNKSI